LRFNATFSTTLVLLIPLFAIVLNVEFWGLDEIDIGQINNDCSLVQHQLGVWAFYASF